MEARLPGLQRALGAMGFCCSSSYILSISAQARDAIPSPCGVC